MKLKSLLWSLLTIASLSLSFSACSDDDDNVVPPTPGTDDPAVSLKTSSLDVAAEGGEFTFEFTVANATDARVEAKADSEWVKDLAVKESRASFDGTVSFTVSANEGEEARKAVITVSYKGAKDASFTLNQAGKKEDPSPVGPEQNGKVTELTPELFTQWIYDHKADPKKENFLSTLPAVIDFYGPGCGEHLVPIFDRLAEAYKGKVNFFRFNFTTPDAREIKEYMGVKMCPTIGFMQRGAAPIMAGDEESNAITSDEIMMSKIEKYLGITLDTPTPGKAPEVIIEGLFRRETNELSFMIKCLSGDATEGKYLLDKTSAIDEALAATSLEELVNEGQAMDAAWFKMLNDPQYGLNIGFGVDQGLVLGESWGCVVEVKNAEGGRTVKRDDCMAEGEPMGPIELRVEGEPGDRNHENKDKYVSLYMTCPTKNAVEAYYAFGESGIINSYLKDMTVEEFMKSHEQDLTGLANTALDELNGKMYDGAPLWLEFGPKANILAGTSYTWILHAKDAEGNSAIKSVEVVTEMPEGDGPHVTFTGHINEGMLCFQAICKTQDATAAKLAVMDKKGYDAIADKTLAQIMESLDKVNVFPAEWITHLNETDGILLNVMEAKDGLVLSGIIMVENGKGVTYRYADTEGGQHA